MYLAGYYCKWARGLSQTQWLTDDDGDGTSTRVGDGSVEEQLSKVVRLPGFPVVGGDTTHSSFFVPNSDQAPAGTQLRPAPQSVEMWCVTSLGEVVKRPIYTCLRERQNTRRA